MKNPNSNYFRLGLFVLIGIALMVTITVIFSAGKLFKQTFVVETYLEGTVTGLEVGAPVRYHGVRVGKVTSIQLSSTLYEYKIPQLERRDYVVVRMQLEDKQIQEKDIEDLIAKDLRAQMKSQGLTGVNYIELYIIKDSQNYPALTYNWEPSNPVISSLPTQTDMVIGAVQKAISAVDNLNLEETKRLLETLMANMNVLIVGDAKKSVGLIGTMTELNKVIVNLKTLTASPELEPILKQTADSTLLIRNRLNSSDHDMQMTLDQLKIVSEQLNDLTRQLNRYPAGAILGTPPAKIQLPSNP